MTRLRTARRVADTIIEVPGEIITFLPTASPLSDLVSAFDPRRCAKRTVWTMQHGKWKSDSEFYIPASLAHLPYPKNVPMFDWLEKDAFPLTPSERQEAIVWLNS